MHFTPEWFLESINKNSINAALIERLPKLGLRQCYITAGCLFQTIWNLRSDLDPHTAIKDYDIIYFDDRDLSWEAEDSVFQTAKRLSEDLPVLIEIKNQARVHLWYEARFGYTCPQLQSTRDGIDRYLISCTCIGIDVKTGELYAPNGLREIFEGVLRINPVNSQLKPFRKKAAEYRARWPWLTIVDTVSSF
jgi:hypothetical protein